MATLARELRKELERTVKQARKTADAGARKAIDRLGVGDADAPSGLNRAAQSLRERLRAHGHQLGDQRDRRGTQAIGRLTAECAYEHWHRMLFARFLAENELLIEPECGVAISLAECQELARQSNDNWLTVASGFAQRMLPRIFRPDDPVLDVSLPPETRSELEDLLKDVPRETFLADDSLGWVYQFWQADKNENVNKSEKKIGADELSAVTQFFTEDYMVLFLIHNTLGAWWAGKVLAARPDLAKSAKTEDELRRACTISDETWAYLRFVREGDDPWRPAAGTFPDWPKAARDLTVLDPCMGSGHFLVFVLPILVAFRVAEERLSRQAAVNAVLRDNLFGLELDARCTQIAAFNVALAAWKVAGFHDLPRFNLACTGLAISTTREHWLQILGREANSTVRFYFGQLYDLFKEAPTLGSLINPVRFLGGGLLDKKGQENLLGSLGTVLREDPTASPERHELGVAAEGLARAANLLARQYTVVLTNVPFVGRGKQDETLKEHLDRYYPLGRADVATAFVLRCLEFCAADGSAALVTPQNWLFLTTYGKLRELLLERRLWNVFVRLGSNAFQDMNWWAATTALVVISASEASDKHRILAVDVSTNKQQAAKAAMLRGEEEAELVLVPQSEQLDNPDARLQITSTRQDALLAHFANSYQGIGTSDNAQFLLCFWELPLVSLDYRYVQTAPEQNALVSGASSVLRWESGEGRYYEHALRLKEEGRLGGWKSGGEAWNKEGIAISVTGQPYVSRYLGTMFDTTMAAVIPKDPNHLPVIDAFIRSDGYIGLVRASDQALSITEHSLLKVPFDLANWQKFTGNKYPNGLPEPESDNPTQWVFHGRPEHSTSPVQVAIARLLGYRWPAEFDDRMRLSGRARDLVSRCQELHRFADDEGIVCIPAVRGEEPAANRLHALLAECDIKPDRDLDTWLRKDFFLEHCEVFHHRPFVWHIWDGRERDGFHALVNYHKLADGAKGRKLLESLVYRYLGDWITRQHESVKRDEDGAEGRLAAAQELQNRLTAILKGEPPFDIFVRWKPIHEQPIGWEPDINDGVRLNIRPFLASDLPGGRTGAGVLRWKPNIKWGKDRGKEPKRPLNEFPWFWGWDGTEDFTGGETFSGERWNDCHYSLSFKQVARERAK